MSFVSSEEKTLAFVAAMLGASPKGPPKARERRRPVVTVSRQTGAGGNAFGEALCAYLERHQPKGRGPWAVVDKELVDKILEDEALPERLASWSPEDHLVGRLLRHRGAPRPSPGLVEARPGDDRDDPEARRDGERHPRRPRRERHPRPPAAGVPRPARRVAREPRRPHRRAARPRRRRRPCAYVEAEDKARQRFIRRYFQVDVTDPLLYNLVDQRRPDPDRRGGAHRRRRRPRAGLTGTADAGRQ